MSSRRIGLVARDARYRLGRYTRRDLRISHFSSLASDNQFFRRRDYDDDRRYKNLSTTLPVSTLGHGRHQMVGMQNHKNQQKRCMSILPEFMSDISMWGATGVIIKFFHGDGLVPYWGCMALTNLLVRISLFPFVLRSAHMSARFAKVAPEIQFLVSIFQNDLKKLRADKAPFHEQRHLMVSTLQTLNNIYKIHKINPLSVFISPLFQLPIFWYFSVDLRKIVNGADPALAQDLTEGGTLWFPNLTDPDPWHGLPIISGLLLYYNVEVAVGKQSLSGETASKSKMATLLKDVFQSVAIFMPCFMSQSPAGVQVYIVTSFLFTLGQGYALRNDGFRRAFGLPLRGAAAKDEAMLAKEFMELKKLEQEAIKAWGDNEMQGKNSVLAHGLQVSFPGRRKPSTIKGSGIQATELMMVSSSSQTVTTPNLTMPQGDAQGRSPFIHGISAPPKEIDALLAESGEKPIETEQSKLGFSIMEEASEEDMERANRGEMPTPKVVTVPLDPKVEKPLKLRKQPQPGKGKQKGKRKKKK